MVFKTDIDKGKYKRKNNRGTTSHKLLPPITMKSIFSVSVFVVLLIGYVASWSYSELDKWPDTCQTGQRQSPIELWRKNTKKTSVPRLQLKNYSETRKATVENNGHTVELKIIDEQKPVPTLSGGNLGEYMLDNIHFHWDSEHTINGKRYALEAHFVHYKTEYGNVTNASGHADGIVVLGVMFRETFSDNKKLDGIIEATKIIAKQVDVVTTLKGLVIDNILPKNRKCYYKYEGSLTTPGCNEVVTWIVFDETLRIGQTQLDELSNVVTSTGEPLTKNFRPLQKLNGRVVAHT